MRAIVCVILTAFLIFAFQTLLRATGQDPGSWSLTEQYVVGILIGIVSAHMAVSIVFVWRG